MQAQSRETTDATVRFSRPVLDTNISAVYNISNTYVPLMLILYWMHTLHTPVSPVYMLGSVQAHMPLRVLGSYLVLVT
jgi:hypothetical protein